MGLMNDVISDEPGFGKKVAENDQWILWRNSMTKLYEKNLDEYDSNGFTLRGEYVVVLAENIKENYRTYLLMNRMTQRIIADWNTPSEFEFKKALILRDLKEACNLVNMAESMEEKE